MTNIYGDIDMSDETFKASFKSIREGELKNNQKVKKVKKVKTPEFEIESETEEEIIESSSDKEPTSCIQSSRSNDPFPKSPVKVECYLRECWEAVSSRVPESDLLGMWCAAILVIPQERKVLCIYKKLQGGFSLKEMRF